MTIKPDLSGGTEPAIINGKERHDAGKKVIINSVGGSLRRAEGVVVEGPYHLLFKTKTKKGAVKGRDGKIHSKDVIVKTDPYWLVRMNDNGFYLHFSGGEITFA